MLHTLCTQWCYERAADQSRKDLSKPSGFLDVALSKSFSQLYIKPFDKALDLTAHFESQAVECSITRDRRAAAGYCDSKLCRFCNAETESLRHLLTDCTGVLPHVQPPLHELGPNFQLLGLVDHPVGIAKHRLAFASIQGDISPPFVADADTQHVWTDGSVFLAESYWLTTAAYSIIDALGRTVDTGPVQSPKLTSYSAELFAIYKATVLSSAAIVIHTDCKCIVDQFHQLLLHQEPLDNVCHVSGGKPCGPLLSVDNASIPNLSSWFGRRLILQMIVPTQKSQTSMRQNTTPHDRTSFSTVRQVKLQKTLPWRMLLSFRKIFSTCERKFLTGRSFLQGGTAQLVAISSRTMTQHQIPVEWILRRLTCDPGFPGGIGFKIPLCSSGHPISVLNNHEGRLLNLTLLISAHFLTSPHRFNGVYRRMSVPLTLNLPFCFGSVASFYVHALRVTPLFET